MSSADILIIAFPWTGRLSQIKHVNRTVIATHACVLKVSHTIESTCKDTQHVYMDTEYVDPKSNFVNQ